MLHWLGDSSAWNFFLELVLLTSFLGSVCTLGYSVSLSYTSGSIPTISSRSCYSGKESRVPMYLDSSVGLSPPLAYRPHFPALSPLLHPHPVLLVPEGVKIWLHLLVAIQKYCLAWVRKSLKEKSKLQGRKRSEPGYLLTAGFNENYFQGSGLHFFHFIR